MLKKLCSVFILCLLVLATGMAQNSDKYTLKILQPGEAKGSTFEDDAIKISFPISTHLSFTLTNKTGAPVQVNWKNASFTDVSGQTHRVICSDVRYATNVDAQPVTVVNPNASFGDTIVPVGFISQEGGEKWLLRPLFFGGIETYLGKSFSLRLPVRIGAEERNYLFSFTVELAN